MKKEVIAYRKPDCAISGIFNKLGTNLEFMNSRKDFRTVLVTSVKPGEGKSLIAANLAVTYANQGNKVVLVDADLRQGRQCSIFGISQTPGLSNYLSGVSTNKLTEKITKVENCLQKVDAENLNVITTGNIPPNPVELLSSGKLEELIEELKNKFDIVIFDGTPGSLVKDTYIVAKAVDTTAIVVTNNKIRKSEIDSLISNIKSVGGHISGIILNKTKKKRRQDNSYYGSLEDFDIQELVKKEEPKKESKTDIPIRKRRKTTTKKSNKSSTKTKSKIKMDSNKKADENEEDVTKEEVIFKEEEKENTEQVVKEIKQLNNEQNNQESEEEKENSVPEKIVKNKTKKPTKKATKKGEPKVGARERSRISKERTNDMLEQINSYLDSKEN